METARRNTQQIVPATVGPVPVASVANPGGAINEMDNAVT